ncbi:antitoxin VapB family protein [Halorussus caseinilyticus]|uniref:Antitoxin VapB family protein n=1 Tax=Halorussus caseinilyticus TaxID=3034025 RepID=A0ABD5WQ36_9EURY|nr:antitoxin VapB family protein [Halorussus sp. DT72]
MEGKIRISDETDERLEARKGDDESVTDLLERLTDDERDIYAGFGVWSDSDATEAMRKAHEHINEDAETYR